MSYQSLAFYTGLFGSLHCVMMCGPLVMALQPPGLQWTALLQKLVYQFGRILTYSIFGLVAGSLGKVFDLLGAQQFLSILSGSLLVLIALTHFTGSFTFSSRLQNQLLTPIVRLLSKWMSKPGGMFYAGLLHGLIPCGMVYMALAGSINTGNSLAGAEFMAFFGLGTTPLLLLSSFMPLLFRRFRAGKLLIPILFLVSGGILITRGLNITAPHFHEPVVHNEVSVC